YLGDDTESALRLGAVLGAEFEVEAYIRLVGKRFNPLKVILTGGDAELFGSALKTKIFARPNLVLEGLNKILQYNVERTKNDF
ncbi:MAG: pantothenate kinase, partial [Bacteroidota bacterium]